MPGDARPPYAPGNPGNPTGGRPKKTDDMRRAEEYMRERSYQGAVDLVELSETSPDHQVRAKLLIYRSDRVFGKPVQAIEGTDDGPAIKLLMGPTIMIPPESSE